MKKLTLFLGMFLFMLPFYAQNKAIDELFDKYAGREGFTSVNINGGLLTLASWIEDDKETKDLLKELNHVRILAMDDHSIGNVNFYNEIISDIPVKDYEELMTVKEKGQDVRFLVKQSNGMINELLMIVGGHDNALISITGRIDPKNLSKVRGIIKTGEHHEENQDEK
jgi:Domain of unknown function (DUF4252)